MKTNLGLYTFQLHDRENLTAIKLKDEAYELLQKSAKGAFPFNLFFQISVPKTEHMCDAALKKYLEPFLLRGDEGGGGGVFGLGGSGSRGADVVGEGA